MKEPNEFKELIQKIINEFSEFLVEFKEKIPEINHESCSKWFFKVKIFTEWSRLRYYLVIDSTHNQTFDVFMKNGYETYG